LINRCLSLLYSQKEDQRRKLINRCLSLLYSLFYKRLIPKDTELKEDLLRFIKDVEGKVKWELLSKYNCPFDILFRGIKREDDYH